MPPLKPRYCIIRALGCEIKFQPIRFWHRVCNNPACKKENMRRCSRRWRKKELTITIRNNITPEAVKLAMAGKKSNGVIVLREEMEER